MAHYEYKVVPAPRRGKRVKGAKTPAARFAHVLEGEMNILALDGWEYVRSETLPVDERSGMFSGRVETYQTMLVYRRDVSPDPEALLDQPVARQLPVDPPLVAEGEDAAPLKAERKQPLFRSRREEGTAEDALSHDSQGSDSQGIETQEVADAVDLKKLSENLDPKTS